MSDQEKITQHKTPGFQMKPEYWIEKYKFNQYCDLGKQLPDSDKSSHILECPVCFAVFEEFTFDIIFKNFQKVKRD